MAQSKSDAYFNLDDFIPELRELVTTNGLNLAKLSVALEASEDRTLVLPADRSVVLLTDGHDAVEWKAPNLSALFRGTKPAPADMSQYPAEYVMHFAFVEQHLMTFCEAAGDQTDDQFEEAYSNLRRRPDGRSLGPLHDFAWQLAAVQLATHPLSESEFDGLFGTLARSARRWRVSGSSRNYCAFVRGMFKKS